MKFSTREDVEAPIDHVFDSMTNFESFERQALRRGAEISRQDVYGKPGLGSEWQMKIPIRGKDREIFARVIEFEAPNSMQAETESSGLDGIITMDLVSLSANRTRLQASIELKPSNLSGRLLIQSLKFAKSNLNKRFSNRVWQFAQDIEKKYKNG